ncbi:MAG: trypsin-like serine protease [Ruminococcaceae bacterium]|nr:trypsin-like serine protease [Oscillospiraceae bacterium]
MNENEKNFEEKEIIEDSALLDPNEQEQAKPHNDEVAELSDDITPAEEPQEAEDIPSPGEAEPIEPALPIEQDAEVALTEKNEDTEVVSAEEEPAEVIDTPVYHWNYETEKKYTAEKNKKEHSRGAVVYAVIMTAAFLLAFAALAAMLIWNAPFREPDLNVNDDPAATTAPSQSTDEPSVVVSEKVIYVKEHDPSSGVLTTQELYSKCLPSVVSIEVSNNSQSGIGSGFIISSDGYIVTANHVVEDMDYINVVLSTGGSYVAKVIDGNEFTDLALIKINKTGLTPLKVGRSSDLLVGDNVIAIGTPAAIDFAGSLSEGVVSYNNRVLKITDSSGRVEKKMTVIQTNALVNPGNSGGPLINEYGEVVGIVSMKLNSTYYEGMCFAIPTDAAMPIITAMKNGQSYDSLLSGVSKYPATLGISAKSVNISGTSIYGVQIMSFTDSSYDISKKMKAGDVITQIGGQAVTGISDLSRALENYDPGDTVRITFYRSGQQMTVNVTLG